MFDKHFTRGVSSTAVVPLSHYCITLSKFPNCGIKCERMRDLSQAPVAEQSL